MKKTISIIGICLCGIIFLLYCAVYSPRTYSAIGDCRRILKDISFRLSLVQNVTSYDNSPSWLGSTVIRAGESYGAERPDYIKGSICYDPWGVIINVLPVSELPMDNPFFIETDSGALMIWSNGPNGKNEMGKEDDIKVLHQVVVQKYGIQFDGKRKN